MLLPKPKKGKGKPSQVPESSKTDRPISDEDLLGRHLEGDAAAFGALIRRYQRELFRFLARFTADAALAEDVFQETFLQLHLSAATFDPTRRLRPWLFTIAANKARDAMRVRSRRTAASLDAVVPGSEDEVSYASLMPSKIPPPDDSLMNLQTRRSVQELVMEMPENLRTVLLLSYFHEFPYKEIAEILQLPLGTVKSRLHAALIHFAQRWKALAERSGHE